MTSPKENKVIVSFESGYSAPEAVLLSTLQVSLNTGFVLFLILYYQLFFH